MIHPVSQRPRARLDLLEQFVYLGEQASVKVAERYFAAVEEHAFCLSRNLKLERLTIQELRNWLGCAACR